MGRYGERLSLDEYERRLTALYGAAPAKPTADERYRLERAELDLVIDYRLGTAYPAERRDALWMTQKRVRGRWGWLLLGHVASKLLPARATEAGTTIPGFMRREYEKVLDPEDLEQFLGD